MNDSSAQRADALEALLQERHSCRGFLPTPIPRETIHRAMQMAQRTASWCNAQPWQVHILSAKATETARSELDRYMVHHPARPDLPFPEAYLGVYQDRRRRCGWQLYESVGITRSDRDGADKQRQENFKFFGAPHVALVTADRALGTYAAVDCGAFVGMFMLAAQSLGVASIAQASLAAYSDFWRAHLGWKEDRLLVCGISMGFEDREHPANAFRTERAMHDEALEWVD